MGAEEIFLLAKFEDLFRFLICYKIAEMFFIDNPGSGIEIGTELWLFCRHDKIFMKN